jgi:DNA-binding NarL/FixJ family response regulator
VLLIEPEAETRAFYAQQLGGLDMVVHAYDTFSALKQSARLEKPDVVIVNPSDDIKKSVALVKSLRQDFPNLPIITMTMTMPDSTIDAIMESGASFHINRGLTKPRDLLLAIEQVLSMK